MHPRLRGMIRIGLTGGKRTTVGSVKDFDKVAPSTVDNEFKVARTTYGKSGKHVDNLLGLIKSDKFKQNEKNKLNA